MAQFQRCVTQLDITPIIVRSTWRLALGLILRNWRTHYLQTSQRIEERELKAGWLN
jgi:hypothetical protein